jgi:hypothetical protein
MKERVFMQRRKVFIGLLAALSLLCAQTLAAKPKGAKKAARQITFKVRIENISSPEGQSASDGTRWPFALSPGLYAVNEKGAVLFREGKRAGAGLEAQAEDGNPEALAKTFESMNHDAGWHGVFNTPAGATGPAPIGPGAAYEFNVSAVPKMKLTLVTMFGQSNDYFYATEKPVELFDEVERRHHRSLRALRRRDGSESGGGRGRRSSAAAEGAEHGRGRERCCEQSEGRRVLRKGRAALPRHGHAGQLGQSGQYYLPSRVVLTC